jgi:hypothetical protein
MNQFRKLSYAAVVSKVERVALLGVRQESKPRRPSADILYMFCDSMYVYNLKLKLSHYTL